MWRRDRLDGVQQDRCDTNAIVVIDKDGRLRDLGWHGNNQGARFRKGIEGSRLLSGTGLAHHESNVSGMQQGIKLGRINVLVIKVNRDALRCAIELVDLADDIRHCVERHRYIGAQAHM